MKRITASHSDLFKQVADNIAQHKRQVIGVGGGKKDPPFAYTIGNQAKGLPELLLIGNFDQQGVAGILDHLSDKLLELGKPFDNGSLVNLGGEDDVLIWDTTAAAHSYTYQAGQFYDTDEYSVQQVVIPDRKGRWPGDPLCHKNWRVPVLAKIKLSS